MIKIKKTQRECKTCSKTFLIYKSILKSSNASGNFCSRPCYNTYLKTRVGEKHNRYSQVELECDNCETRIRVIPAKIKEHNHHFCSRECKHKFHIGKFVGEKNSNWQGGHINRRGNFESVKSNHFKPPQFCALCGTTKKIHIHHIIPFRFTQDNSLSNLIPLCVKHHRLVEILTYNIIETGVNLETMKIYLNNIFRQKQIETHIIIRELRCQNQN